MDILAAPYPISQTPLGYLPTVNAETGIKGDLLQLILTNPGERVMLPTFGTPLRQLFFEPNNEATKTKARELILTAISTWEPRIVVLALTIETYTDKNGYNLFKDSKKIQKYERTDYQSSSNENALLIKLQYSILTNLDAVNYLVLEVPIADAVTIGSNEILTASTSGGSNV